MCLHWGSDTKTGSKGSLGGGITGGVALGVVSWTTYFEFSLRRKSSPIVTIWLKFVEIVFVILTISHSLCFLLWGL
jgi:hypothetical protein